MLFPRRLTLSRKFNSKTVSQSSRSQRRHRRDSALVPSPICCAPTVEELESRQMLSAVATMGASTLAVPTYVIGARLGSGIKPTIQPNTVAPITPAEMRAAYGVNQISFNGVVGDGTGQTVAIVDAYNDPNIIGDAATFNSQFGLQQFNVAGGPTFKVLGQTGTTTLPTVNGQGWDLEESLDVEWVHSMAPKANIILFEANSNSGNDLYTAELTAAGYPGVSVISNSWGGGEYSTETSDDGNFFVTPAGHQGVTFLASTGDDGTPAGYPSYSSDVVAVGGTNLQIQADGTYISESAWSSGGGGISQFESQPSYQVGKVNGLSATQRTVPDVSADADPNTGVFVYDSFSGAWFQVGGTSLSCPLWAGMVAIADQGRILAGETTLNGATQTLPMLYNLPSTDFHDVTTGNNGTYSAGPGYDLTTGRGTPFANLVVPALAGYGTIAPSLAGPATGSVTENSFLTFSSANGNQITATDPFSAGNPDSLTLSVSNGTVTLGSTTGLTFLAGANGSASFTVSGTLGALNAAINGLTYQPTTNYVGSDTLVVSLTDGGESLTGSMNVALTVNAVAPPVITAPATATVTENGSLAFSTANANLISLSDNGAAGTADSATLTVSHGTITLGSATGLIVLAGANGTATVTVKGTVANLNAALNGLVYQPTTNYTGSDTLSVSIVDSHDGLSGSGSVALT
ncbi:MAG TPA: hypothetical protein VFG04_28480, partial [Planctomycetaceae bacterium]|nr:hypothetical protein [Planctomycetaceae bacterium]